MRGRLISMLFLGAVQPVEAQSAKQADAKLLSPLFACLEQSADPERLTCLDRETRLLRQTEQGHGVLLVDKKEVVALRESTARSEEKARMDRVRSEATVFKPVDAPLLAVREGRQGWIFEIKDNGTWAQIDSVDLGRTPKPGDRMRIRRGAVGGFLLNVATGPAIRVRRIS